ncbi:hypothetical protein F66182_10876 [Fusarium sp. NRRL 66182]|nr:hypothetical protein F66182_10876 [Fusarium sp. NRRL 66182]
MQSDGLDTKNGFAATFDSDAGQMSPVRRRRFGFNFSLEVHQEPSSFATTKNASNADFDPIPPSKRTWNWGAFVAYWMADAWAVSNWQVASSMIAVGLSWRLAIGACVLGNFLMGIVITTNGRIGAILHTPFPVLARMPFGYYFSYFVVLSRCVLAIVWLGVQTTTGGQCMTVLLTAIWPSFANIRNHIPESEGITTAGMCGFVLYFLLQLPFLCIPYTKVLLYKPFSIIAPIIFLAVFGDTLHKAGGTISNSTVIAQGTTIHGANLAWAFFNNLNGVLGNYSTLGLNIADFSRYASKPSAQNVQCIVIPFIFISSAVVGLLGIFTAAASQSAYGEVLWNPIDIINLWMKSGSSGGRAAAAFGAIGLIIVTLGINISANSISAANDLMAFAPRYINIRRGQILAAIIGSWAFVPWKILASAQTFIAFLNGYTIFLGPMTSILMTDYYILRCGKVSVPDMYNFHGIYRYSQKWATNWRAVIAFLIGCVPPLPGFIDNIVKAGGNKTSVSVGGQRLFFIGYIYSFFAGGIFYYIFNYFFPAPETMVEFAITGEDIIAAQDTKNLEAKQARAITKPESFPGLPVGECTAERREEFRNLIRRRYAELRLKPIKIQLMHEVKNKIPFLETGAAKVLRAPAAGVVVNIVTGKCVVEATMQSHEAPPLGFEKVSEVKSPTEDYWQQYVGGYNSIPYSELLSSIAEQPVISSILEHTSAYSLGSHVEYLTSTLIRAAWALVSSRMDCLGDVLFGVTLSGRNAPICNIEKMAAPTMATVPITDHVPRP